MDLGGPKETRVQSYSPGGANMLSQEGTLALSGEQDWTAHLRNDAALCQITFTTCYCYLPSSFALRFLVMIQQVSRKISAKKVVISLQ